MFGLSQMMGNYDQRRVARYEQGKLTVSTARIYDSSWPYETAVSHPAYNAGKFVIVEGYHSIAAAQAGHDKWVETMTSKVLPVSLKDVSTCIIAELMRGLDPEQMEHLREDDDQRN